MRSFHVEDNFSAFSPTRLGESHVTCTTLYTNTSTHTRIHTHPQTSTHTYHSRNPPPRWGHGREILNPTTSRSCRRRLLFVADPSGAWQSWFLAVVLGSGAAKQWPMTSSQQHSCAAPLQPTLRCPAFSHLFVYTLRRQIRYPSFWRREKAARSPVVVCLFGYPKLRNLPHTLTRTPIMWGISYWVVPIFSACVWLAMLIAMLVTWSVQGAMSRYATSH